MKAFYCTAGAANGRPLSSRRADLMASELPKLLVDVTAPPPAHLSGVAARVRIEVGFGGGEHLVAEATRESETGFIGIEPFVNGMAKAVTAIVDGNLANVRLFGDDASLLLEWLPPASIDQVDLLYPDPWPKKRHWKRRFVSVENLDRLARVMKTGRACFALRATFPLTSSGRWRTWPRTHASRGLPSAPKTGCVRFPIGRARGTKQRRFAPGARRHTSRFAGSDTGNYTRPPESCIASA